VGRGGVSGEFAPPHRSIAYSPHTGLDDSPQSCVVDSPQNNVQLQNCHDEICRAVRCRWCASQLDRILRITSYTEVGCTCLYARHSLTLLIAWSHGYAIYRTLNNAAIFFPMFFPYFRYVLGVDNATKSTSCFRTFFKETLYNRKYSYTTNTLHCLVTFKCW
jgi:hypothetical protein